MLYPITIGMQFIIYFNSISFPPLCGAFKINVQRHVGFHHVDEYKARVGSLGASKFEL